MTMTNTQAQVGVGVGVDTGRLLAVLMDATIHNAREIAHQLWEDGDEDGIRDSLLAAIDRCESGIGTAADWDMLVEQTEM